MRPLAKKKKKGSKKAAHNCHTISCLKSKNIWGRHTCTYIYINEHIIRKQHTCRYKRKLSSNPI